MACQDAPAPALRRGPSLAQVLRAGLPAYARTHRLPAHPIKIIDKVQRISNFMCNTGS